LLDDHIRGIIFVVKIYWLFY